ncbi:GDSL-like lipase/acylhydrolase family protein [Pseudonocardia sediminis]|uniref:GDSL-like lipase/acylhydrolase family protein n=1 Tax=Pseudonocardia sediminis TaxID=1397368 RepID=A0A4Q7V5K1_PSEST|nr:SGNH/GDSL hydrolase family protein [Pseudonocardia sediminis]RZT89008.1 GDSL-like lipase/acylhydrolase family protein [Pseudonocardia sediminis]
MRRLPVVLVIAVLGVLLLATIATAVLTGTSSSSSSADAATAPAQPAAPAAPAQPAAPAAGAPASGAPAAPAQQAGPLSVAFLGDGYTSGSPAGGQGPANYTALLGKQDGWRVTNESVYGSGYVAGQALQTRLQKIVAAGPQVVVVTAGRADDVSDPAAVGAAATKLYQDLRTRLPQAKIVVIGPMWLGGDAPARMLPVRDAIQAAATKAQLPVVDPLVNRWFNGSDQDGIAPDGEILNDKGHQRLAQLVDSAVTGTGVLPK